VTVRRTPDDCLAVRPNLDSDGLIPALAVA
jgi:hypothetical protein